ncbi:ATPase synthesis protein 25, partial [Striga asiatica]
GSIWVCGGGVMAENGGGSEVGEDVSVSASATPSRTAQNQTEGSTKSAGKEAWNQGGAEMMTHISRPLEIVPLDEGINPSCMEFVVEGHEAMMVTESLNFCDTPSQVMVTKGKEKVVDAGKSRATWRRNHANAGRLLRMAEVKGEKGNGGEGSKPCKRSRELKRFSFDKSWAGMEGAQEAVKDGWQIDVEGSSMFQLSDHKWLPGVAGGKPSLKVSINEQMFWVKDLLIAGGCRWDVNL